MWLFSSAKEKCVTDWQSNLKGYYNIAINVRMSFDRYGSKIRKVSRCRPTVSNETILATKQEFSLTKVAPIQGINDITSGFWLILHSWMLIWSYTTIFFSNVYISVNKIFECSYFFFWLRNRPFIKDVRNWGMEAGSCKMYTGVYRGKESLKISHKIRTY